tara:strand:- start:6314 stop:6865 length:552 start_codon:yes stop_codon:yes gene_type:complete
MDWESKQDVTFDYEEHAHGSDKITAILTQLVELANSISNHLGSDIDPNVKPTTPSQKKSEKVDVVRMAAKPIEQKLSKANHRIKTRDFTGLSISKEDDVDDDGNLEQANPLMAGALLGGVGRQAGGEMVSDFFDEKKQANPMSTSEGKALLASLQEAANKLKKFLSTTMVDSSKALKPNDMRQ